MSLNGEGKSLRVRWCYEKRRRNAPATSKHPRAIAVEEAKAKATLDSCVKPRPAAIASHNPKRAKVSTHPLRADDAIIENPVAVRLYIHRASEAEISQKAGDVSAICFAPQAQTDLFLLRETAIGVQETEPVRFLDCVDLCEEILAKRHAVTLP